MDDNVFAPGAEHGPGSGTPDDAEAFAWSDRGFNDVIELVKRGWEVLVANLGTIGIGVVILFGLNIISQVLNFAITIGVETIGDEMTKLAASIIGQWGMAVFFGFLGLYFQMGLMKMVLQADRGQEVQLETLWSQGGAFIQAVAVSLVLGFAYIVGVSVVGAVIGGVAYGAIMGLGAETGMMIAVGLGGLLVMVLVPALVVLGLGLSMVFYGIVDERASFLEAIPFSWNLTMGWKVFLFIQAIVMFVLALVGTCVTFCMGGPVIQAVVMVVQGVTYNAIVMDADANERFVG